MKYYTLTREYSTPSLRIHAGARKTKEEWMSIDGAFEEGHFERFGSSWFQEVEDRNIEVDICTDIIAELMGLPYSCSRNALNALLSELRRMEKEANDVAKAYGLRVAANFIEEHIREASDPTKDYIRESVRSKWEYMNRR